MIIEKKIHKRRIKTLIKIEDTLHTLRCAVEQIEIAIQRTFSMSNFVCFRIFLWFDSYSLVKIQ